MTGERSGLQGRILVVDDEEPIAVVLAKVVQQLGYEPAIATSFQDVKEALARTRFDLVTLDIVMPGTDGLGILRWLKEHHPDTGVIMATALGEADEIIEAMRLGACDYLVKPFRIDLVEQEVLRAMERQALLAQSRQYQAALEAKVAEQTEELRQLNAELQRQVDELRARHRLVQFQLEYHTPHEAQEQIIGTALELLAPARAALYQVAESGDRLDLSGFADEQGVFVAGRSAGERSALDWADAMKPVAAEALQRRGSIARGTALAVSLRHGKEVMGVLVVQSAKRDAAREETLASLADLAALVLWKVRILARVEQGVDIAALLQLE